MKRTEPFDFYQPTTLAEASRLLKDNGPGGRFLAGGTDLVIAMKEKGLLPKYIVDLKKVPGLTGIRENSDGSIAIGALTSMYAIETSPLITKKFPFLAQSAAEVGSIQIRNRATIGGNMANATPSADTAPSLIALDATAKIASAGGERAISLGTVFSRSWSKRHERGRNLDGDHDSENQPTIGRRIHQILATRHDGPCLHRRGGRL